MNVDIAALRTIEREKDIPFETVIEAIQTALQNAWEGDLVLIAGKGHEDYQDIQGQKHPFDDRKIARQLLHHLKADRAAEREEKAAEREAMRGGFDRPDRFDR